MKRRNILMVLVASTGAVITGSMMNAGGMRWHLPEREGRRSLLIASAGAMVDLCKSLAAEFMKQNPLTDVVIEKGDSLQGLIATKRGAIDLAAITRELTADEDDDGTYSFLIARSNVSIVVNKSSPIKDLTQQQILDLLTGEITNWKMLGGDDATVNVISRVRGSSTRQFVEDVVLNGRDIVSTANEVGTTRLMSEAVAADPYAIGFIASKDSEGVVDVGYLAVDGVVASKSTVLSGRYPYTHSFYLLVSGEQKNTKFDFITFARSPKGQEIIVQQGLMSVC